VVKIKDGSTGGSTIFWNFGDGKTANGGNYFDHRYEIPGRYTITQIVTNSDGCSDTFYLDVIIQDESTLYIPNAFTPDGDGKNDYFIPKLTGPLLEADFKMFIHDRWGDKIFETSSLADPWDGRANGRTRKDIAQSDVYTYIILFKQPGTKEVIGRYTGIVNLIR
jgi:gliding motility-associated-like protein